MRSSSQVAAFIFLFILALGTSPSAYAYLDPGTGSFLLQMLIAGALGAYLYIKLAWVKTKTFFVGLFTGGAQQDAQGEHAEEDETSQKNP